MLEFSLTQIILNDKEKDKEGLKNSYMDKNVGI